MQPVPNASAVTQYPSLSMGRFHGTGGELFGIVLLNALLSVVTLGIYSAWGKANLYRFFYANTEFAGHRFRFTGTGKEIFIGMLKAGVVLIAAIAAFAGAEYAGQAWGIPWLGVAVTAVVYLGMGFLINFAIYGAARYRFSRARYREIAFRLEGSAWEFAKLGFGYMILTGLTLGICAPLYRHHVISSLYNNLRFGSLRFKWDAKASDYWVMMVKGYLLTVITFGIYYFFWYPKMFAFVRGHLTLGGQRFHGEIRPGEFFQHLLVNALLAVVTLGIAMPWIMVRSMNFYITRLSIENPGLLETALQASLQRQGTGAEAVADVMDAGIDIGF